MTELSRSLLHAAREGLAPDAAVAARVRARVSAAVGAAPVAAKPVPSGGSSGALLKLGALAVIAGVVAGGLALRSDARVESPHVSASTTQPDIAEPAAANATRERTAPAKVTGGLAAPSKATHVAPVSLAREVELIDQAMSALRHHDPAAALAAMKTFDRETLGRAQMAEEAAAITIEARCFLGEDATTRIAAFDRAWPSSAERTRITEACARPR